MNDHESMMQAICPGISTDNPFKVFAVVRDDSASFSLCQLEDVDVSDAP